LSANITTTPADIQWLTSLAATAWLDLAVGWTGEPLALVTRLRRELTADQARLVVEQAGLRRRAAAKFTQAERMFFTAHGLEQATDEAVARYKAGRFPTQQSLADLCSGIGGDLMALAERGTVVGVERDRTTAAFALANARAASDWPPLPPGKGRGEDEHEGARVAVTDVARFPVADRAAWHIDPDRRPTGRRTTRVELHEPGPDVIGRLLGECPNAAIKLAPASDFGTTSDGNDSTFDGVPWQNAELEWISRKRQCRQLVAWFGSLAGDPGRRRATRLSHKLTASGPELVVGSFVGSPHTDLQVAGAIGRYVFEPDAAVLAADLTGALADDQRLQSVAAGVAYLTADERRDSPLMDSFEVLDVMRYQVKSLKSWLRARGIGRLEVKKRGVDLDPARVKRELQMPGEESATLLVRRLGGKVTAILARRFG
jgi:hypothetical protein